jgi:hypothetical protein
VILSIDIRSLWGGQPSGPTDGGPGGRPFHRGPGGRVPAGLPPSNAEALPRRTDTGPGRVPEGAASARATLPLPDSTKKALGVDAPGTKPEPPRAVAARRPHAGDPSRGRQSGAYRLHIGSAIAPEAAPRGRPWGRRHGRRRKSALRTWAGNRRQVPGVHQAPQSQETPFRGVGLTSPR